jgi:hypothetical protein
MEKSNQAVGIEQVALVKYELAAPITALGR